MIGEIVKISKIYEDGSYDDFTDNYNYGYSVCECTMFDEAVRVPRPKHRTGMVFCTCPRCDKELGTFLYSKDVLDSMTNSQGDNMTDAGINNLIDRIKSLNIEVPVGMNLVETKVWVDGAKYMQDEILTVLESMVDGTR